MLNFTREDFEAIFGKKAFEQLFQPNSLDINKIKIELMVLPPNIGLTTHEYFILQKSWMNTFWRFKVNYYLEKDTVYLFVDEITFFSTFAEMQSEREKTKANKFILNEN